MKQIVNFILGVIAILFIVSIVLFFTVYAPACAVSIVVSYFTHTDFNMNISIASVIVVWFVVYILKYSFGGN